ncbi:MAG TPA: hypothetical protein VNX18_01570 [Bryobacteraceae bacterium]|nr:hypothetical protein [Bryobacteraceae bacterium]
MKFLNHALRVSAVTLAVTALQAFAASTVGTAPSYDPATTVQVVGIVTDVRQAPTGSPLAGTHVILKTKASTIDVYLAPTDFLKFLKVSFPAGDQIRVSGSKMKFENADVILASQVSDGLELITLRDANGVPDWQHWGQEIDPSLVH